MIPANAAKPRFTRAERVVYPLLLGLLVCFAVDATRQPQRQVSVRLFQVAVAEYRAHVRPWSSRFIRCRFRPTCSDYALEAVERFGIARGLALSVHRIWSCRDSVPLGTYDPVPELVRDQPTGSSQSP